MLKCEPMTKRRPTDTPVEIEESRDYVLETDPVVFLNDLEQSDWDDIARLAQAMFDDGRFQNEGIPRSHVKFKCAVAGFNEWLAMTELPYCVGDSDKPVH